MTALHLVRENYKIYRIIFMLTVLTGILEGKNNKIFNTYTILIKIIGDEILIPGNN